MQKEAKLSWTLRQKQSKLHFGLSWARKWVSGLIIYAFGVARRDESKYKVFKGQKLSHYLLHTGWLVKTGFFREIVKIGKGGVTLCYSFNSHSLKKKPLHLHPFSTIQTLTPNPQLSFKTQDYGSVLVFILRWSCLFDHERLASSVSPRCRLL